MTTTETRRHARSNSPPGDTRPQRRPARYAPTLLALATALIYGTPGAARVALPVIWLASGLLVWLFAREAVHIGASGLTCGMRFFDRPRPDDEHRF